MIKSFTDLRVYQLTIKSYPKIVKITSKFSSKSFHLRNQICRAHNSISAAISEGYGRSAAEFKRYLTVALGSCNEAISHLENALSVEEITKEQFEKIEKFYDELGKQIYRLRENWQDFGKSSK